MMNEIEMAQYLNETEMAQYLNVNYGEHFTKKVTPHDIKRWIGQERITEFTESELDRAVITKRIPPKRGRPSRYSQCDIESIIEACKHMPQGVVAQKWECDPSYVSRLVRGER